MKFSDYSEKAGCLSHAPSTPSPDPGLSALVCICTSAQLFLILCDLTHPSVFSKLQCLKGWPNTSCIHLGKSVTLGHHQSREREHWTAASSSLLSPFWLLCPWWEKQPPVGASSPPPPPAWRSGRAPGDWQDGSPQSSRPPDKGRPVCAALSFLSQALRGSQLAKGALGTAWSCVCIDKHIALTTTVCFKGVSCFANNGWLLLYKNFSAAFRGQLVAVCSVCFSLCVTEAGLK